MVRCGCVMMYIDLWRVLVGGYIIALVVLMDTHLHVWCVDRVHVLCMTTVRVSTVGSSGLALTLQLGVHQFAPVQQIDSIVVRHAYHLL